MKSYRNPVLVFAAIALAFSAPVEGFQLGGKDLAQKGTGARGMAFLTVYYASLYLPAEMKDADVGAIIDADAPMSIVMKIDSGLVKKDSFVSAVKGGFVPGRGRVQNRRRAAVPCALRQADHREGRRVLPELRPETGSYRRYKSAASGQSLTLGTIAAIDLEKAFFAMFIGSNPIDAGLKKGMLGK